MDILLHLDEIKRNRTSTYCCNNSFIELEEEGEILLEKETEFLFNCSWLKKDPFPSVLVVRKRARFIIKGNFKIYSGAKIFIEKNASLTLGSGYINNHVSIHCFNKIIIGEDVAIADNVTIRDSDNHIVSSNPNHLMTQPISIGSHVWIGMNVTILKGVTIGDGAIIGAGSVVTRNIPARCLAAGVPAKVIKENVSWE